MSRTTLLVRAAADAPPVNPHVRETQVPWSANEGQVSNAGMYFVAVLAFWLIVPVLYAG